MAEKVRDRYLKLTLRLLDGGHVCRVVGPFDGRGKRVWLSELEQAVVVFNSNGLRLVSVEDFPHVPETSYLPQEPLALLTELYQGYCRENAFVTRSIPRKDYGPEN